MFDVAQLSIDGAIFHQVPARNASHPGDDELAPVLSTEESALDARLEFFLRDRILRTFSRAAQPIVRDDESESPTPDLIEGALRSRQPDLVGPFQVLPDLLFEVQAHNSPQGLLSVSRGSCGNTPVVIIVKVEQERGLSFETISEDGRTRVEVVVEDGLVLTDKTEVFKSAVFYLDDLDSFQGLVTDDQSGSLQAGPSSVYWLSDFLGCKYRNDIDVMTRSWAKAVRRLVKSDIKDPQEKSAVLSALFAELSSNRPNIDPQQFIEDYVPLPHQDDALMRLRSEGAPTRRFEKSREVADAVQKRKRIHFENGFEVRMPAEAEPDLRTEITDGLEQHVLTIRGHISRVE